MVLQLLDKRERLSGHDMVIACSVRKAWYIKNEQGAINVQRLLHGTV